MFSKRVHHFFFRFFETRCFGRARRAEADMRQTLDEFPANVAGQDDNRILEIDFAPFAVGEMSRIQHLQENIEHFYMCLFNFI